MRDEYDFSAAVRGRHAGRLTVRERGELLQRSAVQDVQTWIISALVEVQRVLLDECVPRKLRRELPGHDVRTVVEMGRDGTKNGALVTALEPGRLYRIGVN